MPRRRQLPAPELGGRVPFEREIPRSTWAPGAAVAWMKSEAPELLKQLERSVRLAHFEVSEDDLDLWLRTAPIVYLVKDPVGIEPRELPAIDMVVAGEKDDVLCAFDDKVGKTARYRADFEARRGAVVRALILDLADTVGRPVDAAPLAPLADLFERESEVVDRLEGLLLKECDRLRHRLNEVPAS